MEKFIINGPTKLHGEIEVKGAKNAALKVLAAAALCSEPVTLSNIPEIEDIHRLIEIMEDIGLSVERISPGTYRISGRITKAEVDPDLHQRVRASVLLVGPMLHAQNSVRFPHPGGCVIGKRPIDLFLEAFKKLGVTITEAAEHYELELKKAVGSTIFFPRVSVTGTEAIMTFASVIPGITIIENAALEPEITSLADFLRSCGAKITGDGTSTITITGVEKLSGGTYTTIPDRIEAGTFAILAAVTRSELKISNIVPKHLNVLWYMFEKIGVPFVLGSNYVELKPAAAFKPLGQTIVTHEYPGLPTDLQAPLTVLATQVPGQTLVFETIYEGRLFYSDTLNSMGAQILMCDPHRILVSGPTPLIGRKISSPDIRAGIALVIAALIAEGKSEITNIYQIDRGYEAIETRLQAIGARIERVSE